MRRDRDIVLALAFAVWGIAGALLSGVAAPRWQILLISLPIAATLVWRRSAPRAVAAVLFVFWIVQYELGLIPNWGISSELLPPVAVFGVAAYLSSARAALWQSLLTASLFSAVALYLSWRDAPPFYTEVGTYVFPLAAIFGAVAPGIALRDRSVELDDARARLREEERAQPGEADRLDAARMTLAREIHVHLTARMREISVHVAAARAALEVGSLPTWRAAMRGVSEAAAEAMHGLRATLMVLRDERRATGTEEGAEVQLRGLLEYDGVRRGTAEVAVTVEGRLPEPMRAIAAFARRIAADGVELVLEHARGPAMLSVSASVDGVIMRFGAGGTGWWRRSAGSVERARLLEVARLGGLVRTPRPWRPELEIRLVGRAPERTAPPDAWRARARCARGRLRSVLDPGMSIPQAFLPIVLLGALGLVEVALTELPGTSDALRAAGAIATALPFLFRRRAPLLTVMAVVAMLLGRQALGDLGTPTISQNFYLYLAMWVVGAYARSIPTALAGWVLVFGGGLYGIFREGIDYPIDAHIFYTVAMSAAGAAGFAVRRRVTQTGELVRVRATLAQRHQAAVDAAVAAERMAVARELHDVVGHSVTVMAVQAGAAAALAEKDPEAARTAARSVIEYESAARAELDQLLRALASADPAAPVPATLDELEELVERGRRAGLPVTLTAHGDLSEVAPWLLGTVYRLVQEALTNVRRHAGDAETTVAVRADGTLLHVEVRNAAGAPSAHAGSGAGITGMRERVRVHGGSFEAGPAGDGGWYVRALMPLGDRDRPSSGTHPAVSLGERPG